MPAQRGRVDAGAPGNARFGPGRPKPERLGFAHLQITPHSPNSSCCREACAFAHGNLCGFRALYVDDRGALRLDPWTMACEPAVFQAACARRPQTPRLLPLRLPWLVH
eukprot:439869-Alexandrium_andersonii.AAC.1